MSYADELYKKTCLDILENGFSDAELEVRPRWGMERLPTPLRNSAW